MGRRTSILALACAASAACASPRERKGEADREVARVLEARRCAVPLPLGSLDPDVAEARGRTARAVPDRLEVDLPAAIRLATEASRDYRSRREEVYLKALAFTLERQRLRTQGALGGTGALARDETTGTLSGRPEASLSRRLESGGELVVSLATDFLRTFTGDPASTARTILAANLSLPLARGASRDVVLEPLVQAERDVVYEMRGFARLHQELTAEVATSFWRVLQQRDTVANEELTETSLGRVLERAKSFGPEGAGRLPDFEVDQARTDVLRARDRVVRARQQLEAALDGLKLTLGVPPRTVLVLAADALEALRARGLEPVAGDLRGAVGVARARRLDLASARDEVEDAARRTRVAADGLGPDVSLELGATLAGPATKPLALRRATGAGSAGLDVSLPVERTAERNAYRTALIQEDRARRAFEALEDRVVVDVRSAWRTLEQARTSYDIQQEGVRLALRRVESADLNLQYGKASTRDLLEAEDALIEARNGATAALVDHAIARLELERDTGALEPEVWTARQAAPAPPPAPPAPAPAPPPPPAPVAPPLPPSGEPPIAPK